MPTDIIPRFAGLYILPYAIHALRNQTVTPRGAILLAHVDRACNSYRKRHPEECHGDDSEWTPWNKFSTGYLQEVLACDEQTVRSTIMTLARPRNRKRRMMRAQRLGKCRWRLWAWDGTEGGEPEEGDTLYIPGPVRRLFEAGALTPMEAMLLSLVASFTRRQQLCYASNKWIGRFFGVGPQEAQRVVKRLVAKGLLRAVLTTQSDLADLVAEQEHRRHRGDGGRTARLLTATVPGLIPEKQE